MAVICLQSGDAWLKARWAHRRFLRDVIAHFPEDLEMIYPIEQGMALDGLHLDLIEKENAPLANRILDAMRVVARDTVSGRTGVEVDGQRLDIEGQKMYVEAVTELLGLINKSIHDAGSGGSNEHDDDEHNSKR